MHDCLCSINSTSTTPPFVGDHYYCEVGDKDIRHSILVNDPLWDGQCVVPNDLEAPCCDNPQPWFARSVESTADDELRLCERVTLSNHIGENTVLDTIVCMLICYKLL